MPIMQRLNDEKRGRHDEQHEGCGQRRPVSLSGRDQSRDGCEKNGAQKDAPVIEPAVEQPATDQTARHRSEQIPKEHQAGEPADPLEPASQFMKSDRQGRARERDRHRQKQSEN